MEALSPVLEYIIYYLVLEKVIREINILEGITLGQITNELLAYADDIAFLGEDLDIIKRLGNKIINTAKRVGLTVYEDKIDYLVGSRININNGQE